MSNFLGAGQASAGISYAGYGTPATTDKKVGALFQKSNNEIGTVKSIDPIKRDYKINSSGQLAGMNLVQQQVYLALTINKGTSASPNLGSKLNRIQLLSSNVDVEIEFAIKEALSDLLNNNIINIISISIDKNNLTKYIKVLWEDLTLKQINTNYISV